MRLEEKEYHEFLAVHPKLLYYAGINHKILPANTTLYNFTSINAPEKFPTRESLYENIGLIDQYLKGKSKELLIS